MMIGNKELWKSIGIALFLMMVIVGVLNLIMNALTGNPIMVLAAIGIVVIVFIYHRLTEDK